LNALSPQLGEWIAELTPCDSTGDGAIDIVRRALAESTIGPIETTVPLFQQIMGDGHLQRGDFDTRYISRFIQDDDEEDDE